MQSMFERGHTDLQESGKRHTEMRLGFIVQCENLISAHKRKLNVRSTPYSSVFCASLDASTIYGVPATRLVKMALRLEISDALYSVGGQIPESALEFPVSSFCGPSVEYHRRFLKFGGWGFRPTNQPMYGEQTYVYMYCIIYVLYILNAPYSTPYSTSTEPSLVQPLSL